MEDKFLDRSLSTYSIHQVSAATTRRNDIIVRTGSSMAGTGNPKYSKVCILTHIYVH